MAKKTKTKAFSFQGFDAQHYKTTEQYAAAVDALFDRATKAIADAAAKGTYNPDKPFSFDDYPSVKAYAQKIITGLANNITSVVTNGSRKQWLFACQKNDEFVNSIIDTSKVSKARLNKMQDRNLDAMKTFQGRKVDGMNLSERVWKYTQQFKAQIELGLDVGLGEGRSAQQLSRDLRQNLQDPDRLFRRVRDKRGNLQLSKAAKAFHPGIGVYRSSAKNAARLTRSEINMAYREADWMRWQQLDFVVGFEVHRSNREPRFKCALCDKLVGRYPKTFKFKGWHPQCMCYATAILMDENDFDAQELSDLKSALHGTPYKKLAVKQPEFGGLKALEEWAKENQDLQGNWGSTPYFIKDNFNGGLLSDGLRVMSKETPKIDLIQQQLDQLQPSIAAIKQMANEWGLNTYIVDDALAKRNPQGVINAISEIRNRVNTAMNELKLFVTDAAETIKQAKQANVDAVDMVNALSEISADKRDWIMSKAAYKQTLANLKSLIANAKRLLGNDAPHKAMKTDYSTAKDVDETMKQINSEFTQDKWFEHGDCVLSPTNRSGVNGFTSMDGRISLKPQRLDLVRSAMAKIGNGKSADISFDEADAMATYWHEITHNRNLPGNTWLNRNRTAIQTDVMEMMNEFVARKTLPDFYTKMGCAKTPHPEFINNRDSTGYNRRVLGYDYVIQKLGLDAKKVLDSAKKNLFTLKYSEQETTATQALLDGGLDTFKGANGKKIKVSQLKKIVALCRKGASTTTIEHYMENEGIIIK